MIANVMFSVDFNVLMTSSFLIFPTHNSSKSPFTITVMLLFILQSAVEPGEGMCG